MNEHEQDAARLRAMDRDKQVFDPVEMITCLDCGKRLADECADCDCRKPVGPESYSHEWEADILKAFGYAGMPANACTDTLLKSLCEVAEEAYKAGQQAVIESPFDYIDPGDLRPEGDR
jgi:hypothetical protein